MDIQKLKSQLDIETVARHIGIKVDPRTHRARCPFHNDKNPSLQFSKEKQICTCFSTNCDAGTMDVINLVEKYLKLTTRDALVYLTEEFKLQDITPQPAQKSSKPLFPTFFKNFKNNLRESKKAQAYLHRRMLHEVEAGYNARGWDKMQGCIIFPLRDQEGEIASFYGRSIEEKNTKSRHYYNSEREGLYPGYDLKDKTKLLLTESVIDAATLLQLHELTEEYAIIALYGTKGLTAGHREIIARSNLAEVILYLDGDPSGREGSYNNAKVIKELRPDIEVKIVETEEGEDINSLALKYPGKNGELSAAFFLHQLAHSSIYQLAPVQPTLPPSKLDTTNPWHLRYTTQVARYAIKGGVKDQLDSLRVTLEITHPTTGRKSRTKVDLYEDRQTDKASREAAERLGLRADLLLLDLEALTDLLDAYREKAPEAEKQAITPSALPADEKKKALDLLHHANPISRLNTLIGRAGVVGEVHTRQLLFCVGCSYKMPDPLHALIQGSSGSGKTHLLHKIMSFMPETDTYRFTRITEGSLYNYGEYDLEHKLIGIEDYDGLEEKAELALRELQSSGMISSSTSDKDEQTGKITARPKVVRGPIASLAATTRGEIYEDNMSRCFLVAIDESQEQTEQIITYQNQRRAGLIDKQEEQQATKVVQACVRLLKPYEVINPYAHRLQLPPEAHKIRRLNDLFQAFVNQVTLINQYQRKQDSKGRLITQVADLETAIEIMFDSILLKVDELDGSLRHFYEQLKQYVESKENKDYRFTQRELRHALKVSKTQLHRYMNSLLELEYIHQMGGYANRGYTYRISYWDSLEQLRDRIKRFLRQQVDQLEIPLEHQEVRAS